MVFVSLPNGGNAQTKSTILTPLGETGATSYITLPFTGAFLTPAGGASPFYSPGELFWANGPYFTSATKMADAKSYYSKILASGVLPYTGAQLWVDTFEISQPASLFPNEPASIAADRASNCCSDGAFQAWVNWVNARPNLLVQANDGGSLGFDFRAWNSSWGHITPNMPLAPSDCPPGMSSCVFADFYAYRWAQTSALTGVPAIGLSDFADQQPYAYTTLEGYNPELIAGFEAASGITVPAGTTTQKSDWIRTNAITAWNDHVAAGYGYFFGALASRIGAATNLPSLVIDQCSLSPSLRRYFGIDPRIIQNYISGKNYMCTWDAQTMQVGRSGGNPVSGLGSYAIAAARDPWVRNGANLEANDQNYWNAIASFYPNLGAADQQEFGLKLLKQLWLEASWSHIATQTGSVRRALAYVQRDYFDGGTIDSSITALITSIYPAAPFGFGVYYSTAAERAVEANLGYSAWAGYYALGDVWAAKQAGLPFNYYVSDAAINALPPASYPSAWVILDSPQLIPAAEMARLNKTSNNRVFTSVQAALAYSGAPLKFTNGLIGTGFYDQNKRLIITVTNTSANPVAGFIQLQGLTTGSYKLLDLFTNQTTTFTVSHGGSNVPVSVTRWDTRAFAITGPG